ncbi:MAG: aminopeptidase P N-terminal domain-containing protein, partial [Bacteroidota bacterium]|nr:aminopeptidase P N-terminal domain-containing protein [Bacteroidota bacterium]
MKPIHFVLTMVLTFTGISTASNSQTAQEFMNRRKEVISRMVPGSVMILRTSDPNARFDVSRRGGNFYYLTGIDEPGCTLVLLSNDLVSGTGALSATNEVLFIRPLNSARVNWDAQTIGIEGAKTKYGLEETGSSQFAQEFTGRLLVSPLKTVYIDMEKPALVNAPLSDNEQLIKMARDHGATFTVLSPSTIIKPMLSVKSPAEIELTRKAVEITAEAQREAIRSLKPDMYEYQLEAVVRYVFSVNGSKSLSFPTIIGSGINSVVLHWMENSKKMEAGDLVVVDCGAEKDMYCADITRTYPVSGKYTERQKAIYDIVLNANEEAI